MKKDPQTILEIRGNVPHILGLQVFQGTKKELLADLESRAGIGSPQLVVTTNVDHLINLSRSQTFQLAYKAADICTFDGAPLVTVSRILGARRVERITGADLIFDVAHLSAQSSMRMVIVGGRDGVAGLAAQNLRDKYKYDGITAVPFPYIQQLSDDKSRVVISALRELEPDFVFICLGSPKQELWFDAWKDELPPAIYFGSGAAVDFAAGTIRRCPEFLQTINLEWAFRLSQDFPRLAHRYLIKGPTVLPIFLKATVGVLSTWRPGKQRR